MSLLKKMAWLYTSFFSCEGKTFIMEKVLVIDDDRDILELVKIILTSNGINVVISNKPETVKSLIKKNHPDILLMDISMGTHDGRKICKDLKTNPEFSSLPIVLFSANKIDPQSVNMSCADGFLQKPFDINSLINTIHSHMPA